MTFPRYSSNLKVHFWTLDLVFIIFKGFLFQMLERNVANRPIQLVCVFFWEISGQVVISYLKKLKNMLNDDINKILSIPML